MNKYIKYIHMFPINIKNNTKSVTLPIQHNILNNSILLEVRYVHSIL